MGYKKIGFRVEGVVVCCTSSLEVTTRVNTRTYNVGPFVSSTQDHRYKTSVQGIIGPCWGGGGGVP